MTQKRLEVRGGILIPANMAEAGKIQALVAEAVGVFAEEMRQKGVELGLECRIVSSRPPKAKVAVSETGTPLTGPAVPLPDQGNGAEPQPQPTLEQHAQPQAAGKPATPLWATR